MTAQESNKIRDRIIEILEENEGGQKPLYPLLHFVEAQLSAKEQECEKYKKLYDAYATGPVINPLYADNGELCGYSLISRDTGETLCSEEDKERFDALDQMVLDATRKEMRLETELASLRAENELKDKRIAVLTEEVQELDESETDLALRLRKCEEENERLKTTLVAGAELIKENWDKLCDEEGYGPQNLLLRMDGTLNTSGYPGYSSGEFEKLRKRCEDMEAENQQLKLKVVEDAVRFSMYMTGKSTIGDQDYFRRSFEAGYYKTWKIDN